MTRERWLSGERLACALILALISGALIGVWTWGSAHAQADLAFIMGWSFDFAVFTVKFAAVCGLFVLGLAAMTWVPVAMILAPEFWREMIRPWLFRARNAR